jgi:COMPASS component SWD3
VAWSRDSRILGSASDDKCVNIWNVETGKLLRILRGHTHAVTSIDFNYKGNLVASGSADENVRVWDVNQGRCLKTLAAHSDPIAAVHFSRDGTLLVSASHDGLIRLWDTASGHCLKTLVSQEKSPLTFVRFSPNGKYLLASAMDGSLRLWDYLKGAAIKTYNIKDAKENKYSCASTFLIEDDGSAYIVQGDGDNGIAIWDAQTKARVVTLSQHKGPVFGIDISPTTHELTSCSADGTILIWERSSTRSSR